MWSTRGFKQVAYRDLSKFTFDKYNDFNASIIAQMDKALNLFGKKKKKDESNHVTKSSDFSLEIFNIGLLRLLALLSNNVTLQEIKKARSESLVLVTGC